MTVKAPLGAPESESLTRLEAAMEGLAREISGLKADIRGLRNAMNRFMLAMTAMWVATIITILLRT